MKILKIEFKNINSLRGNHEIDFTAAPFIASSLFAITGPTGSGKSSILDVISLALFNQIPRIPGGRTISKNDILKFGAILTRNQKNAMAKVTYQCNSGIFSSEWCIDTNRNDKLRDHEMEIIDLTTGNLLDLKKSDVPAKNEELIGLSYDQFIKAVLLAQGEFAQFLKVNKKERGALLEKITGTGIYRKLGMRAYDKYSELNKEIEKQQHEIQIISEQLLTDEKQQELSSEIKNQDAEINTLTSTVNYVTKNIELKNVISNQLKEIKTTSEKQNSSTAAFNIFNEEFGTQLKHHEEVHVFGEDLRKWSSLNENTLELKQDIEKLKQDLKKNLSGKNEVVLQLQNLTNQPAKEETFESLLEHFKSKILGLQEERKAKQSEWELVNQSFLAALRPLNYNPEKDPETNCSNLISLKLVSEKNVEEIKEKLDGVNLINLENSKKVLKHELEQSRLAEKQHAKILSIGNELEKITTEKAFLESSYKNIPQEIKTLQNELQLDILSFDKFRLEKENHLLRASFEEVRNRLKNNEPCPLCGSLEHPFAAHLPEKTSELDSKIAKLKSAIDINQTKLATLKANLNNLKLQIDIFEKKEIESKAEVEKLDSDFNKKFKILKLKETLTWEAKVQELESKLELLGKYELELHTLNAIEEALPITQRLKKIIEEGKAIASNITSLYKGEDVQKECKELQNKFTRIQQENLHLLDQEKKIESKIEVAHNSITTIENKLTPLLTEKGFKSIPDAKNMLLSERTYLELRTRKESFTAEIDKYATAIKLLQDQLSLNKQNDTSDTIEVLKIALLKNQDLQKSLQERYEENKRQYKNHQENLERRNSIKLSIQKREEETLRWRLLNTIIGDRTGNKFNEFAQDLTLSQLLQLANVRLRDLSDRYLIDKPTEDEDDGLVAIDEHMGGQRRSVKTLSGGETFILSLSLALALSDLASKNVEINSLFIDEGFGTLDPETLDQTLDTLERLQAESSKTIGIISHVDSLKERIGTQIKLTRNGQGYSSLEVVG